MDEAIDILLVDDEPRNLDALEAALDDPAYRLVRATDADTALRRLLELEVAAIVLDIKMPGVSGFELATIIKGSKKFRQTPILFLTAQMLEDEDMLVGYGAGAVDYLTKPFNAQILRHKIAVFAELFRKSRALAELNAELEARVKERTAELQRSQEALLEKTRTLEDKNREMALLIRVLEQKNKELDQFAYVASHDLKAPLRGITSLSSWIEEDLADKLPPESKRQMELLRGRVRRMEGLIDGIHSYSRAGRVRDKPETIALSALLDEVRELLSPRPGARIEYARDLPTIVTEKAPMEQVLMNLVGNALKHAKREDPVARIEVRDGLTELEVSVIDNGPGIAEMFHERIWQIFQTLEPRDTVENTGIGLAIVKKIIEQRGGRVWLESAEGKGSKFCFTWPKGDNR